MKIGDRRLPMTDRDKHNNANKFRMLYSLEREVTPELIWENSMREELRNVLTQ